MPNQKSHKILNGIELKYCRRCCKWKTLNSFYKDKRYIDGLSSFCKKYYQQYGKKYKKKNKIRIAEDKKRWDLSNPEKRKAIRKKHIKKINSTVKGRLTMNIRRAIRQSLRDGKNGRHWEDVAGYTLEQLKSRLTKTMPKGYFWNDYLDGRLHVDHKIPIKVFNFEKISDDDFQSCWALGNLQLLPAAKNISKGSKIVKHFQPSLIF